MRNLKLVDFNVDKTLIIIVTNHICEYFIIIKFPGKVKIWVATLIRVFPFILKGTEGLQEKNGSWRFENPFNTAQVKYAVKIKYDDSVTSVNQMWTVRGNCISSRVDDFESHPFRTKIRFLFNQECQIDGGQYEIKFHMTYDSHKGKGRIIFFKIKDTEICSDDEPASTLSSFGAESTAERSTESILETDEQGEYLR